MPYLVTLGFSRPDRSIGYETHRTSLDPMAKMEEQEKVFRDKAAFSLGPTERTDYFVNFYREVDEDEFQRWKTGNA